MCFRFGRLITPCFTPNWYLQTYDLIQGLCAERILALGSCLGSIYNASTVCSAAECVL